MADPVTLGLIGIPTVIGMQGAKAEGEAAERAAKYKAQVSRAAGSRSAYESKRAGDITVSDARAAMAAGGGSASDAGAVETLGKIKAEADYNVLASLYEGETGAYIAKEEGRIKKKAAKTRALSTALRGGAAGYKSYKTPLRD